MSSIIIKMSENNELLIRFHNKGSNVYGKIHPGGYIIYENEIYYSISDFMSKIKDYRTGANELNLIYFQGDGCEIHYSETIRHISEYFDYYYNMSSSQKLKKIYETLGGRIRTVLRQIYEKEEIVEQQEMVEQQKKERSSTLDCTLDQLKDYIDDNANNLSNGEKSEVIGKLLDFVKDLSKN